MPQIMSTDNPALDAQPDRVDRELIRLLQESGRMTLAELARHVGMSSPGVSERLRRLEQSGVISGYGAVVDPYRLGYRLHAFVRLATFSPVSARPELDRVMERPEVIEAHHVVGEDCWIFKVIVRDTTHLEDLLLDFARVGTTTTSIVLSSPVNGRAVTPADEVGGAEPAGGVR
ncbi:Lrp/AsnC family transcriptional regulator [Streptomyces sp. NBC_01803]|uniref:Lrp/AsnC family transcriptional regulator n=1 Tax=Streptomyces sp. NBC_01803 TaxID=2975946 RepID=UPI002DDC8A0D|nr:Lrp/AsnC family transcriptional regulator [Streptomyces sp. NBC_01803]WSA43131.1 Lrp/AsnC family transcriptional regulator [Streptomyces sp. NBC_01803]